MRANATRRACPPEMSAAGACHSERKLQAVAQGGDPLLLRCGGGQSFCNSKMNIFSDAQVREEAGLLRHVAERAAMQRQRRRKKLLAVELDKAVIGLLNARDAREHCALARARRAE